METADTIMVVGGRADGARLEAPVEPGGRLILGGDTYVVDVDAPIARPRCAAWCTCGTCLDEVDDGPEGWHLECPGCGHRFWFPELA